MKEQLRNDIVWVYIVEKGIGTCQFGNYKKLEPCWVLFFDANNDVTKNKKKITKAIVVRFV